MKRACSSLLLAALTLPSIARAQDSTDPLAATMKSRGDAALVDGRFADALDAYDHARAIEPNPALDYNRGRALQALDRHPEALEALESFQRTASPQLLARVPKLADLLSQERGRVSTLRVSGQVPNARYRLGARELDGGELASGVYVAAGSNVLVIESEGYLPYRKTLQLAPGKTTSVAADLVRRDESALLRVRSPVPGARVFVDGELVSEAPAELRVAPRSHAIRVEHAGYEPATVRVVLGPRETRDVDVALSAHGPITSRVWFWVGVGGVAIAATAVVIALTTEKSAGSGDIAPGTVSAPLLRF